jgi:hypothetical protein
MLRRDYNVNMIVDLLHLLLSLLVLCHLLHPLELELELDLPLLPRLLVPLSDLLGRRFHLLRLHLSEHELGALVTAVRRRCSSSAKSS